MTDLENFRARLKNANSDLIWACQRYLKANRYLTAEPLASVRLLAEQKRAKPEARILYNIDETLKRMVRKDNETPSAYLYRIHKNGYLKELNHMASELTNLLSKLNDGN